jgi:hypothetical protein
MKWDTWRRNIIFFLGDQCVSPEQSISRKDFIIFIRHESLKHLRKCITWTTTPIYNTFKTLHVALIAIS